MQTNLKKNMLKHFYSNYLNLYVNIIKNISLIRMTIITFFYQKIHVTTYRLSIIY